MEYHRHIVNHYNSVFEAYINTPFYLDSSHTPALLSLIKPLTQDKVLLDLGCGTCHFSERLGAAKLICVDPSAKMLFQRPLLASQHKVLADGLDFLATTKENFDLILLKECLHHFQAQKQLRMLEACRAHAQKTVVVTRPHLNRYPWFNQAQRLFEDQSVDMEKLLTTLESLGFSVIEHELVIPVEITKEDWLKLLKQRFWSHLSFISEEMMKAELIGLEKNLPDKVFFEDHLVVVVASQ